MSLRVYLKGLLGLFVLCGVVATSFADDNTNPLPPAVSPTKQTKEELPPPVNPGLLQPRLSQAGIQRVNKNLLILGQNIHDCDGNLSVTDRNIKTLEQEISDLDKLERDHRDLRGRLQVYLTNAQVKVTKSEVQMRSIATFERQEKESRKKDVYRDPKDPKIAESESRATHDRNKLIQWQSDADYKVKRVNEMLKELQYNVGEIQGRRDVLKSQLSSWTERRGEFVKLAAAFKSKKSELEKLLEN
jgi:hypothetical protein